MLNKNKIFFVFAGLIILALVLCIVFKKFYLFYRKNLIKKITANNKVIWELEDQIIKNSSFILKSPPKGFPDSGFTEKYFFYNNIKEEWFFKLEYSKLAPLGEKQLRRFVRFFGCATPFLNTLSLPINNKLYFGSIQEVIPTRLSINNTEDIKKMSESQIRYLLKCRVLLYLLDIDKSISNDLDVIISRDGTLYIVDLDRMLFPSEMVQAEFKDFCELLNFDKNIIPPQQLKVLFEHIKRIPFEDKKNINISRNVKNWRELCQDNDIGFWEHLIRVNISPNIEEMFKLINFTNELSKDDFYSLIEMPELKGNHIWEDYLSSLQVRRRNLRRYWELFFSYLNREYRVKFKLCFNKIYTLSELREIIEALESQIEELSFKKNQLIREKKSQKPLEMITCPVAWWIYMMNGTKALSFNECVKALLRLKEQATSDYEKKAINYYLDKIHENGEFKREDRLRYYLEIN